ncbi:hypothetical protein CRP01_08635 [Flavilitoribacter nigricans DSM 23189 = NBRC 102662]|uniref:Uncharacterized protein n=1 Tax=Flavilitoribacter nigricans (strain ATCC 23147 / DSM 23189 / NBRC 102662 / NCIMB 1420 / SS-2) TaxID=1122177 RepID=A0A2D0NF76_FLAN2|nr:hypothetical protein CRP01_08635 [Flavilitoribacter nigricans DSM 23189 = NBRC 102662]
MWLRKYSVAIFAKKIDSDDENKRGIGWRMQGSAALGNIGASYPEAMTMHCTYDGMPFSIHSLRYTYLLNTANLLFL